MKLRAAVLGEQEALSRIAYEAKAVWGYSRKQLDRWRADLTICAESLRTAPTLVAEIDGRVVGFCQIRADALAPELGHLFVDPRHMRMGVGRALLRQALERLAAAGVDEVAIDADPHAEGFYAALGARRVGVLAAPIEGERLRARPQLRLRTAADRRPEP
jgi:predicted N-acetyltransferase YhbS